MSDYQLTYSDVVVRTIDGTSISNDPGNRDRSAYSLWLAAGGVPDPYVAPATVAVVSQRQARLALLGAGMLDAVNSAVTAAGGSAQITWEYAEVITRDDPLITAIGSALGLTPAQIDALFATAATL